MKVSVTQFLRPNGRAREMTTVLPDGLSQEYQAMQECGVRFTAEELTTGEVSLCIEDPLGDFDIRVTTNGPAAPKAMAEMLQAFSASALDKWRKAQADDDGE